MRVWAGRGEEMGRAGAGEKGERKVEGAKAGSATGGNMADGGGGEWVIRLAGLGREVA